MAAKGNGTTQYLATAGTIVVPQGSYSYSFWYKNANVPNTSGSTTNPMGLDAGGGATQDIGATWHNPSASFYKSFVHIQAAGGACRVQFIGTPTAAVWAHFCVTWDGTTLSLYYNGVLNNSTTGTVPPAVNPTVTVLAYSNGASGFDDGAMGELTVWNVCLTAAEAFSLGKGKKATDVQNAAIIFYSTLNTGDAGQLGPVITNHSTVINSTYFEPLDGGLSIGGDMPLKTVYTVTMDGGLAIGSDSPVTHSTANGAVVVASHREVAFTTK